eukprot:363169-Chlamydomonas_euryale.AAC.50
MAERPHPEPPADRRPWRSRNASARTSVERKMRRSSVAAACARGHSKGRWALSGMGHITSQVGRQQGYQGGGL